MDAFLVIDGELLRQREFILESGKVERTHRDSEVTGLDFCARTEDKVVCAWVNEQVEDAMQLTCPKTCTVRLYE